MKHKFSIILVCLIFAAFSVAVSMAALTDGLVAYWPLDETSGNVAHDVIDGNDGELQGGPVWSGGVVGAGALTFNGIDTLVRVTGFDVVGGSGITIACWVITNNLDTPGNDPRMVSKAIGGNSADHWFMLSSTRISDEKRFRFRLKTDGTTDELKADAGGVIDLDTWIHVAVVWDGSDMMIYKNGALAGSLAKGGTLDVDPTVEMAIGSQPATADARPWDGSMDDVAIWNRGLSAEEVNELMNTGIPTATAVKPGEKLTTTWGEIKN